MSESVKDVELCKCGHPLDPHVMATTGATPFDGGVMFCPECECWSTWSVPQMGSTRKTVRVPDEAERESIRELLGIGLTSSGTTPPSPPPGDV